jgi:hypothetical protein
MLHDDRVDPIVRMERAIATGAGAAVLHALVPAATVPVDRAVLHAERAFEAPLRQVRTLG